MGQLKGGTWRVGVTVWTEQDFVHKLFGVGPDAMSAYLTGSKGTEIIGSLQDYFGTSVLTNAHGEWITILANLGLVGLIGFVGMMVSAVVRFLRGGSAVNSLVISCGLSLLAYTVNNVFSFQQIMNVTQMFIVLGMGECVIRRVEQHR